MPDNFDPITGENLAFRDPENPELKNDPNWRWNQAMGMWEPGNANMDLAQGVTNFVAPGATPNSVQSTDPGASLNTGQPDEDRARMGAYLAQLTEQAKTGSGAWEQSLKDNTHATQMNASALGQTAGLDPMNAARNVGNAQAGADQRAVGQGKLLRAQTQQQAQGQLADVLGGQGATDAQQAAGVGAANQMVRATNVGEKQRAGKAERDAYAATGQTALSMFGMSAGGAVPGTPEVFGDDSRNDVVPAKLSPGEIVIPISITSRPDAAQAAAAFVEAVKARGATPGQENFDTGGVLPPVSVGSGATSSLNHAPQEGEVGSTILGGGGSADGKQQLPSIRNGGLLDTEAYNQTRGANLENSDRLLASYLGKGPSTAPQAMQNATDTTLADAMRAQAGSRSPLDVTGAAAEQSQGAAGNAAGIVAGESQRGGEAFAQAIQRQRAQDLAFATAQQQAAWRNTMMNAGISLEQQNQLKGLLGAAGTGAVAVGGLFDKDKGQGYDPNDMDLSGGKIYDADMGKAHGGEIGYAEGGVVASHLSRQGTRKKPTRPGAAREERAWSDPLNKAGSGGPEEWSTYDKGSARSPGTQRERDGLEQHFAGGGPVFEGERPSIPQPGPFAANTNATAPGPSPIGMALKYLASLGTPPELDPNRPRPGPTSEELALQAKNGPSRPVAAPPVRSATPAPPPVAPAAPKPAARPAAASMKSPAAAGGPDQYALAMQAGEQKAAADTTQADATSAALMQGQQALEANAIDQKERAARAQTTAAEQLGAIQQAREEMKRQDTEVDTGRFWSSRSVPGKIAAIMGLVLGAIGNDNGVNRSAMMLNQLVDRDIEAQKASHELAMRKGQSAVDSAQNLYTLTRQMNQDDIAAGLAAKGTALDLVANKIALAAAQAGSPQAKANLTALHAKVMGDKDAADKAAANRLGDNALKWYGAKTDRMQAEAQAAAAGNKAEGKVLPAETASGIADLPVAMRQLEGLGKRFTDLNMSGVAGRVGSAVAGFPGMGGSDASQYNADALLAMQGVGKIMEGGKLAAGDEAKYRNMLPKGGDSAEVATQKIASAKRFLSDLVDTRKKFLSDSGYKVPGMEAKASGGQDDAGARAWLAANPTDPRAAAVRAKLGGP
jgi:hypothetical protein